MLRLHACRLCNMLRVHAYRLCTMLRLNACMHRPPAPVCNLAARARAALQPCCRQVGGRMVYSTCTFNPIEDEAVVAELLLRCQGALQLVDVSGQLPQLVRCPGLRSWRVRDKFCWYDTWQQAETVSARTCIALAPAVHMHTPLPRLKSNTIIGPPRSASSWTPACFRHQRSSSCRWSAACASCHTTRCARTHACSTAGLQCVRL